MIPPNITVSSFYDDTPNVYCDLSGATYNCPIQWHTADENHAKVWMYINPNANFTLPNGVAHPPCWRVFLPNGLMEEFGCTPDSLRYYYTPNMGDYISGWLLDLITDRHGNQIQITYRQDMASDGTGHQYPRDTVLQSVEWDSPTCQNTSQNTALLYCTTIGTAPNQWAPLMRVYFDASHTVAHPYGATCSNSGSPRCDDPADLSGSGGDPAPKIQSTWVLNDIKVEVRNSASVAWSDSTILRDYQLGYEQTGNSTTPDTVNGQTESVAGALTLRRLQQIGDDFTSPTPTTLPAITFKYTSVTQWWVDSSAVAPAPNPAAGCGATWNSACNLWDQSRASNSSYLSSVNNGLGAVTTYTYVVAHNNTHGGYSGNNANPLSCDGHESTSPCQTADDEGWSHAVITQAQTQVQQSCPTCTPTPDPVISTTTLYSYTLTTWANNTQLCSDCVAGMYWGNQNDVDYLDYYNPHFMGFTETDVQAPDGAMTKHKYYATDGWGVWDTAKVSCAVPSQRYGSSMPCHNAPWWGFGTAEHGREYETDAFDVGGTTWLSKTTYGYALTCPPSGVSATPASPTWGDWDSHLVSMMEHNNPVAVCDIHTSQVDTYTYNGASTSLAVPHSTTTYSYDTYGRLTDSTVTTNVGGATGSATSITYHTEYVWNDSLTPYPHSTTGTYIIDSPYRSYVRDSGNTIHAECDFYAYDGLGFVSGQQSGLTYGQQTAGDVNTSNGTTANSFACTNHLRTTHTYDSYGNLVTTNTPDVDAGVAGHAGCVLPGTTTPQYSLCQTYDSLFHTLPLTSTNAFNHSATVTYGNGGTTDPLGGFGLWSTSVVDANGQNSSVAYDHLGRLVSTTAPLEGTGLSTTTHSYTVWCPQPLATDTPSPQKPCVELDESQRLDSSNTVTTRRFYDGEGHLIETRSPAPTAGQDLVTYATYDFAGRLSFQSLPYTATAYTGAPGSTAFSVPDASQSGTSYTYPNRRETDAKDPLSYTSKMLAAVACSLAGLGSDTACYAETIGIDRLNHQSMALSDALGRTLYSQRFTGSGTYTPYATTRATFGITGALTAITSVDINSTLDSFTYDGAGRVTGVTDVDSGTWNYTYDNDSNVTQQVDARGASGTVYAGYDGLDRLLWKSTSSTGTSPLASYTYDEATGHGSSVGRLTTELFASGPSQSVTGSYSYSYDGRGRPTSTTFAISWPATASAPSGNASYSVSATYDDANRPLTLSIPAAGDLAAETLTYSYGNATQGGALTALSSSLSSPTSTIFGNVSYEGHGLLSGWQSGTAIPSGSSTTYQAGLGLSYDGELRLSGSTFSLTNVSASTTSTISSVQPSYDAEGNVTQVMTTLPTVGSTAGGNETQAFCYDDLDRLIWAGTQGTGSCGRSGSEGITSNGGAGYTASYTYDNLGRIRSASVLNGSGAVLPGAAQGSFFYNGGTAAGHLHALNSVGSGATGYSAGYDAAGDMTCRAVGANTCASAPTSGQMLGYDALRRLLSWQNASTSPTQTGSYAYDGRGERVWQQATNTSGGTTTATTTVQVLGKEDTITTSTSSTGGTTIARRNYALPGGMTATRDASGLSYAHSDTLGTPIASLLLDSATVTGTQLRTPYGQARYSASTTTSSVNGMHTPFGFAGQREDSSAVVGQGASGLDYFHARYYDSVVGRFTSADSMLGADPFGDGYAYVGGNPETKSDPTGHDGIEPEDWQQIVGTAIIVAELLGNAAGITRVVDPLNSSSLGDSVTNAITQIGEVLNGPNTNSDIGADNWGQNEPPEGNKGTWKNSWREAIKKRFGCDPFVDPNCPPQNPQRIRPQNSRGQFPGGNYLNNKPKGSRTKQDPNGSGTDTSGGDCDANCRVQAQKRTDQLVNRNTYDAQDTMGYDGMSAQQLRLYRLNTDGFGRATEGFNMPESYDPPATPDSSDAPCWTFSMACTGSYQIPFPWIQPQHDPGVQPGEEPVVPEIPEPLAPAAYDGGYRTW